MRCLVLSDIHSNLEALHAVLDDAGSVDEIWCLGDVVGYGPDPNACVELLRDRVTVWIAGNHDWGTLGKLDLRDFNSDARDANLWNRRQLSVSNLTFLQTLPETWVEGPFTLVHGSPRHPIWEYVIHCSTAQDCAPFFHTPFCLVGHTHTPVIFQLSENNGEVTCESVPIVLGQRFEMGTDRLILNPGSVGQPRDGDPRASYLILDPDSLTVEYHRVAYPVEAAQAKMMDRDLPMRLIMRLAYGW
jgi:predicted phosphodiesterase